MLEVREGNLTSLAALFERHHRQLFNFFVHLNGSRESCDDLVQDVFFRMLKYKATFQPENSFAAWMYRIARNTFADSRKKRRFDVVLDVVDDPVAHDSIEERLSRRQEIEMLRRALAQLPAEKRELLVLSRFENLKYEEIAAVLDCEVGAVKVRVFRAVRALAQIYTQLSREKAS